MESLVWAISCTHNDLVFERIEENDMKGLNCLCCVGTCCGRCQSIMKFGEFAAITAYLDKKCGNAVMFPDDPLISKPTPMNRALQNLLRNVQDTIMSVKHPIGQVVLY